MYKLQHDPQMCKTRGGSNNSLRHEVDISKTAHRCTIQRAEALKRPQHGTTHTHLGADVVLGSGLREALNVHGVLRDGRHAAPAPLAPLLAVLAAVLSSLSASCAAPPVAVAAPAAASVGLTVLVALAGGADAGDRCPLLELQLLVRLGGGGCVVGKGRVGWGQKEGAETIVMWGGRGLLRAAMYVVLSRRNSFMHENAGRSVTQGTSDAEHGLTYSTG